MVWGGVGEGVCYQSLEDGDRANRVNQSLPSSIATTNAAKANEGRRFLVTNNGVKNWTAEKKVFWRESTMYIVDAFSTI